MSAARRFAAVLACLAFPLASGLSPPAHAAPDAAPDPALAALFEREFKYQLEEFPEQGTYFGVPGYNDRLFDGSAEAVKRRREHGHALIAELERFDPARLSTQDRISRAVALDDLRRADKLNAVYGDLPFGAGFFDGWLPISTMHGPHHLWSGLAKAAPFRTAGDYENYLKRLSAMPRVLGQATTRMEAGMRSGWVAPRAAMERVPAALDAFASSDPTATPLWKPFKSMPDSIPAPERERIAAEGRRLLVEQVNPAFARFQSFLAQRYLPACSPDVAASRLPGGMRYYTLVASAMTTTDLTPDEIHETGLKEVARIRAEMERVMASTGFKGDLPAFFRFLKTDPRFFFKTPEERLRAYRDIAKRADAELPKLFKTLPRAPYGIRAMEAYEGDNSDSYTPPAMDGSRAGFFEANVNNLEKRPSYEMETTLLHEAVPGHHLQNARALELDGLPLFRRSSWYVGYGEGWALYAESLGYDMGFYKDPYQHFGHLQGEMLRACRLVIDSGLHAKGWSRERAIQYLIDNDGVHPDYAVAEVDRYIVWPGQALGYKVGELKIRALREKAKRALGDRFDIRGFHNAVLDDGALPLSVLEQRIDDWIAAQKSLAGGS